MTMRIAEQDYAVSVLRDVRLEAESRIPKDAPAKVAEFLAREADAKRVEATLAELDTKELSRSGRETTELALKERLVAVKKDMGILGQAPEVVTYLQAKRVIEQCDEAIEWLTKLPGVVLAVPGGDRAGLHRRRDLGEKVAMFGRFPIHRGVNIALLAYGREKGRLTAKEAYDYLREKFGISTTTVDAHLRYLASVGTVKRDGPVRGPGVHWVFPSNQEGVPAEDEATKERRFNSIEEFRSAMNTATD